ncbi:MAG: metal-dependent transcriptional regulator [Eubacteriales bacterium]|nr:metal-dependent transcriptional regulator [Eubacteriales bacterium]
MALNESGEMYLESILVLSKKNNMVRSVDVAEYMQLSKPAVSRAIGKLKAERYILVDADGHIALTESGREIASGIYERHIFLTRFLIKLGVDEETAKADACKMEHDISDKTFEAMKLHAGYRSDGEQP